MPIRAENRGRYPKDWKAISAAVRKRAGDRCEWCGIANGALGARRNDGAFLPAMLTKDGTLPEPGEMAWCGSDETGKARTKVVRIVLTTMHLDHTPENCDPANLKSACQRCHNGYDAPVRAAGKRERFRARLALADLFAALPSFSPTPSSTPIGHKIFLFW
jgi:hypothetical protein